MSRGDKEYNISASQVKAHSKCPKQWWFRYQSEKEPSKSNMQYLWLGSRVHESIEEALTAESPPPLDHQKALQSAFQNLYREKDEYPVPDKLYKQGMECCEVASKFIVKGPSGVPDDEWNPTIEDIEKRIEYDISRPDVDTGVTAIMDVVTEKEIWDWKTGSIRDDTPHEEKIQGSIYMAAYFDEYGEAPEAIRFVYLKEGKVRDVDPSDEVWEYMLKRAKALVHAKETGEFPGKAGSHCYWCDYEFFCDVAPTGVGGVPWSDY